MKAYVLAAGYATRMYPLTRDVPKALLEVGGVPLMTRIARRLTELDGLTEIVVVTNARFFERFQHWADEQQLDVPLTVLNDGTTDNESRLGATRDLQFALERSPPGDEHAVVLASDNVFSFDVRAAQEVFRGRDAPMVMVRRLVLDGGPSRYSEVTLGPDDRIVRMREKPSDPQSDLSGIAFYFFPNRELSRVDEFLEHGNPDAPGHFLAWLVDRVPCYGLVIDGPWYDIGSLESLEEARRRLG